MNGTQFHLLLARSSAAPYIDVELVPDYIESDEIHRHVLAPTFQANLAALRAESIVNFSEVFDDKTFSSAALLSTFS